MLFFSKCQVPFYLSKYNFLPPSIDFFFLKPYNLFKIKFNNIEVNKNKYFFLYYVHLKLIF